MTDKPIEFRLLSEDNEGNEWLVEDVWEELGDYIVGLEIIAFVADKEQ
ncbi:hypothetical protein [Enterococcus hirae]|nr:hypothetical protein [Enterococcus hirae]